MNNAAVDTCIMDNAVVDTCIKYTILGSDYCTLIVIAIIVTVDIS